MVRGCCSTWTRNNLIEVFLIPSISRNCTIIVREACYSLENLYTFDGNPFVLLINSAEVFRFVEFSYAIIESDTPLETITGIFENVFEFTAGHILGWYPG